MIVETKYTFRTRHATTLKAVAFFLVFFLPLFDLTAQATGNAASSSSPTAADPPSAAVIANTDDADLARAKVLLSQQKIEEALTVLYKVLTDARSPIALEAARLVFDADPKFPRLISALETRASRENDLRTRVELSSMLGRLYIAKRDYAAAQRSFALGGAEPGLMLASARLLLLLGQFEESQRQLDVILSLSADPAIKEAVLLTKAWRLWSEGDYDGARKALSGYETGAGPMYMLYVMALARSDAKDALTQSDLLRSKYPHSLYAAMLDDDTVHADPALSILLGIVSPSAQPAPSANPSPDGVARGIQVGYFKAKENADKLALGLRGKGFNALVEQDIQGGLRFLVLVAIRPGQDPQTLLVQLKDQGFEGFLVF